MKKVGKKNSNKRLFGGGGNFSCRHPKLWSYIKSNIKAFFITGAIVFTISASATTVKILHSRQVRYKNDKSVEQAINELYEKASRIPKNYSVGDHIKVNNEYYYVIADSPKEQDYVVVLKENPLTTNEVNLYGGVGSESNYVNRYTSSSVGTAGNHNGYGYVAFNSSETCGWVNGTKYTTSCNSDYNNSDIKHIIDNWANDTLGESTLKNVNNYKNRLITLDELYSLGYTGIAVIDENVPFWLYNSSYMYWTMTSAGGIALYYVRSSGKISTTSQYNPDIAIRPVINVYKSAIQKTN